MKKALFLVTILTLSVFSTACINNLAVQELNNKATEYMKKGDYENAIKRLESSVDLDGSIFETRYNLAIAYTENEDYDEAIEAYEKALELKPDSSDVYYSRAVMYENYGKDIFAGNTKKQKEELNEEDESDDADVVKNPVKQNIDEETGKYKPTESEIEDVKKYYTLAIEDYNKYLEILPNSEVAPDVRAKMEQLQSMLQTLDVDTN